MAARRSHCYLGGDERLSSAALGDQFDLEFDEAEETRGELADVDYGDEEDDDDGNDRIPPHEYLARTRVASLSVHEGVGRTLKGRDLSRVRNAIWKQTGFED
ncbi:UNVERIFIED_CONTAM: hypothetical protein Sangu_1365600 [Sesamum angustifolium]|uniref:Senescence regulator n=1 Tax=Sesamum angustifolium TaxID=2727405 RepID=A0AAW2N4P1_9LAMI